MIEKLVPEVMQNLHPDGISEYLRNKNITKAAGRLLQAIILLGKVHFIGALNKHLHGIIDCREVVTAFWIVVNPERVFKTPVDTPIKQAAFQTSVSFAARMEEVVRMLDGKTTIDASIFIPAVLEVLHTYAEYMTAFEIWVDTNIVPNYLRMRSIINLFRSAYMECRYEDDPQALNLLNDMMYVTYYMQILESLYPDRCNENTVEGDNNNLIPY